MNAKRKAAPAPTREPCPDAKEAAQVHQPEFAYRRNPCDMDIQEGQERMQAEPGPAKGAPEAGPASPHGSGSPANMEEPSSPQSRA